MIQTAVRDARGGIAAVAADDMQLVPLAQAEEVQLVQPQVPLSFLCQRARWTGHDPGMLDARCTGCQALHLMDELPEKK